jgi:hypothetical protein
MSHKRIVMEAKDFVRAALQKALDAIQFSLAPAGNVQ